MGETERELRLQQLRLVVCVMFVLFAFMLAYTIYWVIDYRAKFENCGKTIATVTSHKEKEGISYDVFEYKVDGHEYIITSDIPSMYDVGEEVSIYYEKESPICLVYDIDNRQIILPIITSAFGCVCVGLGVVYILIKKSNKIKKEKAVK